MVLTSNKLLMETGDVLLQETEDIFSIEPTDYVSTLTETVRVYDQRYQLDFDGVNDYVDFGDNLDKGSSDPFSISSLINVTTNSTGVWASKRNSSSEGWEFRWNGADGKMRVTFEGSGGDFFQLLSTSAIAHDQFIELVATYDGSSNASGLKMYADGVAVPLSILGDGLVTDMANTTPLRLGARNNNTFSLTGAVAKFRMHNAALSQAEVTSGYDDDSYAHVEAYWDFKQGKTTTLIDVIGGVNGTISAATWSIFQPPLFWVAQGKFLTETIVLVDTLTRTATKALSEVITLVDTLLKAGMFVRAFNETVVLVDTCGKVLGKIFTETITLVDVVTRTISRAFTETVMLVDTVVRTITRAFTETLTLADTLTRTPGKFFTETVTLVAHIQVKLNGILTGLWAKTARVTSSWSSVVRKVTGWDKVDRE